MMETPPSSDSDQSSSQHSLKDQSQVPVFDGLKSPDGNILAPLPGLFPPQLDQEQMSRGPGIYAVTQPIAGLTTDKLIHLTYNIPTTILGAREVGGERGEQQREGGPHRQVFDRIYQIVIHLDVLLILKLAAVIFLFNRDGSKQRLALLVLLALLVYLHQTGALAPVIGWLSQRDRRAVGPRAGNLPVPANAQGYENVGLAGAQPEGVNENQHVNGDNIAAEIEHVGEPEQGQAGNWWWGIAKEIQLIASAFINSLLPGFDNLD